MIKFSTKVLFVIFFCSNIFAQTEKEKLEFDGQVSAIGSFSPENDLNTFLGIRYIPELSYGFALDSTKTKTLDFEASTNLSASLLMHPFDSTETNADISPYRIWARYTAKQFELRIGLQKIDFGAASLLRPIQWFNQIDPRDPLQLTNGVYGVLGRYYFLNNANIWLWALYGNEKTRGFDAIETNRKIPEMGGRVQYPMQRGEIAVSYHHRTANSENMLFVPQHEKIPEHRVGIDGKWDIGVGLWFEAAYIHKTKNINVLTHQNLLNIGADYTFGIGNGLNIMVEHLTFNFDETALGFENTRHFSAAILTYPLGFFDNISAIFYYDWTEKNATAFLNYEHQFKNIVGYLMLYYNPDTQQGIQQNDFVNQFSGPGVRVMLVYNH